MKMVPVVTFKLEEAWKPLPTRNAKLICKTQTLRYLSRKSAHRMRKKQSCWQILLFRNISAAKVLSGKYLAGSTRLWLSPTHKLDRNTNRVASGALAFWPEEAYPWLQVQVCEKLGCLVRSLLFPNAWNVLCRNSINQKILSFFLLWFVNEYKFYVLSW